MIYPLGRQRDDYIDEYQGLIPIMTIGPWIFNGFDMIVLAVIIISLLTAASRGLLREMVTIIALIVSVSIALFIFGRFRTPTQDFIQPAIIADIALFGGTAIFAYMFILFILKGLSTSLKHRSVGFINRLLGAGFGVIRGLIVAAIAVMVFTAQYRSSQEAQKFNSYIAENHNRFPPDFIRELPEPIRKQLEAPPAQLPNMLQNSTFYPVLDKIGNQIRRLPFAKAQSLAEKISSGEDIKLF